VRHLFLRIFLWFWAAMAAVATVLIVSSPMLTRSRPGVERWQREAESSLQEYLERSARELEEHGTLPSRDRPRGGPPEERRHHGGPPLPLFALRPDGTSANDTEVPSDVGAFARRVAAAEEELSERSGTVHMVGRPVAGPGGERLVLVAAVRRPPRLIDLLEPGFLGWRLAVLTALVGAVCLWLAWTLSSPVTALRGAVRRLATGDLTTRVVPAIARRRDEVGDLARDFDAMAARLETLVGTQRRLLRDVSHELRSPLARLAVALELARGRASPSAGEHLDRIALEAGRLEALIDQLLTLSRLEAASEPSASELVDFSALVGDVVRDAAFEASGRSLSVTLEAAEGCAVSGDAEALRSAVDNVLRNAIRFTAEGSEVAVSVSREGESAEVRVADRGPGVPEESLADVFEPFSRVEDARERGRGGAGLGLAIARRAVTLHAGSIIARNRDDGGLEVIIRLPANGKASLG